MADAKLRVISYGSTFLIRRRAWRIPPGGRPRLIIRGDRELPLPWWVATRIEPTLADERDSR